MEQTPQHIMTIITPIGSRMFHLGEGNFTIAQSVYSRIQLTEIIKHDVNYIDLGYLAKFYIQNKEIIYTKSINESIYNDITLYYREHHGNKKILIKFNGRTSSSSWSFNSSKYEKFKLEYVEMKNLIYSCTYIKNEIIKQKIKKLK